MQQLPWFGVQGWDVECCSEATHRKMSMQPFLSGSEKRVLVMVLDHRGQLIIDPFLSRFLLHLHLVGQFPHDPEALLHGLASVVLKLLCPTRGHTFMDKTVARRLANWAKKEPENHSEQRFWL